MISPSREGYSLPVDIYSFGLILYELMTLKVPYSEGESLGIAEKIRKGELPVMPPDVANHAEYHGLHNVYSLCVQQDPKRRPSAADLVAVLRNVPKLPAGK